MGDSDTSPALEIIEEPSADDAGNRNLHIAFHAEDVDAVRSEMEAAGLGPSQIISPSAGVRFFYVKDPAGVDVQII